MLCLKPWSNTVTKADYKIAKELVLYGVLKRYSKKHGYCNPSDEYQTTRPFWWRGEIYVTQYIDGCFYPFLLKLNDVPASERIELRACGRICSQEEAIKRCQWEG